MIADVFERAVAEFQLGAADVSVVRAAARDAIGSVDDAPALERLANEDLRREEAASLVVAALCELARPPLDGPRALRLLVEHVAREIVERKIDPIEGAVRICAWQRRADLLPLALHPFVYWESEAESRPEDRALCERAIRVHAEDVVNGTCDWTAT